MTNPRATRCYLREPADGTVPTEMGKYLVGAYLKLIVGCDFVDYNAPVPGGGLAESPTLTRQGEGINIRIKYV